MKQLDKMNKLKSLNKLKRNLFNHKILQQKNHPNLNTKTKNRIQTRCLKKLII